MHYLAHISEDRTREQSMLDHLTGTAEIASQFAQAFSCGDLGYTCGLLHDIGKYSHKFQRRIRNSGEKVDHSTAGAQVAFQELRNPVLAFCIAGHHGGLPDGGNRRFAVPEDPTFFGKMCRQVGVDIEDYSHFKTEISYGKPQIPACFASDVLSAFFFTRMLYSCLVDADFLDTEAFMQDGAVQRGGGLAIDALSAKLDQHIAAWWDSAIPLNQKRCVILKNLIAAGNLDRGLFSLTVPTGGGKTVSSMAFALRHAMKQKLRRIIYVIPYTSIIEQTQQVFEDIFGAENVVAHYASLDYTTDEDGKITDKRYLATENWDAPIIITTAVQFFESLYANRSSRCRKLHNIASSVLVFDEAQMLPIPYLQPCIAAISQLVQHYGCSAVLCTATQPALAPLFQKYLPTVPITELCPDAADMHTFFRRVRYETLGMLSDEHLACRLNAHEQVLCIVNNRKQAQNVYTMLTAEGSFHLSTTMYPVHRRRVLTEIRKRLHAGKPCRVISTSLIEAGVDVDFPVVYRAFAGLDSIIQAGGRCNREGKRTAGESVVYIFETEQRPPRSLEQNISAAQRTMRIHDDPAAPEAVADYFDFLYYKLKDETELDQRQIIREIQSGTLPFATVADAFHIIDNAGCTLYIALEEGKDLAGQLKLGKPTRGLLRKLGQYAISVYADHLNDLIQTGAAEKITQNTAILWDISLYQEHTGLLFSVHEGQGFII